MGGGSDTPDAPDYQPVIDAITKGLGYSAEQAKTVMSYATEAYKKNKGTADEFIKSAMDMMDTLGDYSAQDRADYEAYRPAAAQQLAEAMRLSSAEEQEMRAGRAEQDVQAKIKGAQAKARDELERYGIPPDQIRDTNLKASQAVQGAGMAAAAGNDARIKAQEQGRAALAEAIAQGNTTAARALMESGASLAAGGAAVTAGNQTEAQRLASMGSPTQWQGLYNQGTGQWGETLNTEFGNEMDRNKAEQESSSGWGSILGTVAPIASKFFLPGLAEGGVIPDPTQMFATGGGPVPIEASESAGAIPDDVPAVINGADGSQQEARLNAGEFVVPQDVMKWMGEKGMQQMILKARKEMTGGNGERPAQPEMAEAPPPGAGYESVGAIPAQPGAVA